MLKVNKLGVPFEQVGNRLKDLDKELNKHGIAILQESMATLIFGDPSKKVVTEMTLQVGIFEKPVTFADKIGIFSRVFKKYFRRKNGNKR